jgi:hypothetical protein
MKPEIEMARGIVNTLRAMGPRVTQGLSLKPDSDVVRDFHALFNRAAELSSAPTDAELEEIWNAFLSWTGRYGLLPSDGKVN